MNDTKTIAQKIESGHYNTVLSMPRKPKLICPNVDCATKFSADQKFCSNCGENLQDHSQKILGSYNVEVDAFRKEEATKFADFKTDVIAEFGLDKNPKKESIFGFAWEQSRDKGFQAVITFLEGMHEREIF